MWVSTFHSADGQERMPLILVNVSLCFMSSLQQAEGPAALTVSEEEARLEMNESPWDEAEL